ncbi:MAG: C45 family autoproteolytic acyltransferase/hydrolase, partial [Nocardioidaceae bacterium]
MTADSTSPVIRFTSTVAGPRDRGVEFGERFAPEVAATVASYRTLFAAYGGPRFDFRHWAERAWEAIERLTPEYAEEIAGIAAGARRDVVEVAAINARTELLVAAGAVAATECSTVVTLPADGPPVAVQTWDWYDAMADGWLEWTIPHPDGRVLRTVTEYGMLAKIGVNGAGLGVMLNMLHHANDEPALADDRIGFPVHLLSRTLLDRAESLKDALALTAEVATTASTSLTVADRESHAATIELFPGG